MGAGHHYPDKEYLLVNSELFDVHFDDWNETMENLFNFDTDKEYLKPIRPGVEEKNVNVYLYKELENKFFEKQEILVGLKHDNYNTILVAQSDEDFDYFDFNTLKDNELNEEFYFWAKEFSSYEFFQLFETLTDIVDDIYEESNKVIFQGTIDAVKSFLGEEGLSKIKGENERVYVENIIKALVLKSLEERTKMTSLFGKEKIKILDTIVKENIKGSFSIPTSAWTSEVATSYKQDEAIKKGPTPHK